LTIAHSKIRKIPIVVPAATAANEYRNALLEKLHNEKDRKQQQKSPPSQSSAIAIRRNRQVFCRNDAATRTQENSCWLNVVGSWDRNSIQRMS
jgi:hypothetical protein